MKEGGEGREKERVLGKRERERGTTYKEQKQNGNITTCGYTGCSVVHFISAP